MLDGNINHEQKIVIKGSLIILAIGVLSFISIIPNSDQEEISVWSFIISSIYIITGILGIEILKKTFNETVIYGQLAIIVMMFMNLIIGISVIIKGDNKRFCKDTMLNEDFCSLIGWVWTIIALLVLIFMVYLFRISLKCRFNNSIY